ncbi:FAD-binding domain-containing protein [Hypoxylon argillaceum]|nr:FAD-binding domain-containing protein [Hypoxylon argillaceum]
MKSAVALTEIYYIPHRSQTACLRPACFVRPTDHLEVAAVIRVIKAHRARFAIRAGGHNPNANFASINNSGILVDLQGLNSIALSADGILRVGPGKTWEQTYQFAQERGRYVIGGRHGSVGISGLLLGGGLSFFPSLFGMAVDSVVNFEVVLSNSTIVNANTQENPDLYRALKGGSGNFGVVTRFDIETYAPVPAQYTINIYNATDYFNVLHATARLQLAMESDPRIGFFLNVRAGVMVAGLLNARQELTRPPAFEEFFQLKSLIAPLVRTTDGPILDLVPVLDHVGQTVLPARRAINAVTTKVDPQLYVDVHKRYIALLRNNTLQTDLSYTIQAIPRYVAEIGQGRRGGNSLGLSSTVSKGWACLGEWLHESMDSMSEQHVLSLGDTIRSVAGQEDNLLGYIFMNDAGASQRVIESYGTENGRYMKAVATKYDPTGVFQKQRNGGFFL